MRSLTLLHLVVSAALIGCASPLENRELFSELTRLCEVEAGTRVYQANKWPGKLEQPTFDMCPDNSGERCIQYRTSALFSKSEVSTLRGTTRSRLEEIRVQFVSLDDRSLVAEQISYLAVLESALPADDKTLTRGCSAMQVLRVVPTGSTAK